MSTPPADESGSAGGIGSAGGARRDTPGGVTYARLPVFKRAFDGVSQIRQ
jgi:hypothetical protein